MNFLKNHRILSNIAIVVITMMVLSTILNPLSSVIPGVISSILFVGGTYFIWRLIRKTIDGPAGNGKKTGDVKSPSNLAPTNDKDNFYL